MKIDVGELEGGAHSLVLHFDIGIGLGDVDPETIGDRDLQLLAPTISWTQLKINEATYFLRLVKRFLRNEAATQYHFNGFVTALNSVIDVLVNEAHQKPAFKDWVLERKRDLMKHQDFIRFVDLRNKSVHRGAHPPRLAFGGLFREYLDGRRTVEPIVEMVGLNGKEIPNPVQSMDRALEAVRNVVDEATAKGFIERKKKPGHAMQLRFWKETEPGKWREAQPREMAMFDPSKNDPGGGLP